MEANSRLDMARRRFAGLVEDFRHNEDGATAIEYGLIVALIFLAIVASVRSFTASTSSMYDTIDSTLEGAQTP